ncbi:MAG TPA: hypothetical protein VHM67_02565 [Gemmatimonadaceae bacterium]|nr:hypothetical protein [Gemmatimonadaceae bacterium]
MPDEEDFAACRTVACDVMVVPRGHGMTRRVKHLRIAWSLALSLVTGGGAVACVARSSRPPKAVDIADPDPMARSAMSHVLGESGGFRSYSGVREPTRAVIRDADAWRRLWSEVTRVVDGPVDQPVIDFTRDMLLVAGLGYRGDSCCEVRIDSVQATPDTVIVIVTTTTAGLHCGVFATASAPLDIIRIRRSEHAVRFVERSRTRTCAPAP